MRAVRIRLTSKPSSSGTVKVKTTVSSGNKTRTVTRTIRVK